MTPSESALNDRVIASMRQELKILAETLRSHKASGCTEPSCPGSDVVSFYKRFREDPTILPAAHWLFVALHMLATAEFVDPFDRFEEAVNGQTER